jgi:hypothetical protein
VENPPGLFVAHCQHRHFDRHDPAFAVIVHHLRADISGRDQLAHQPVIVDVNIVNETVDAVPLVERGPHQCAKSRGFQLRDSTPGDKLGCAGVEQVTDLDRVHGSYPFFSAVPVFRFF